MTIALNHQHALLDHLDKIYHQHHELLSFADFMKIALYAPGLGYYSAGKIKLGSQGDFVTAPEISSLFSQCLAIQCKAILSKKLPTILELGAGSGKMASDLLQALDKQNALPDKYYILEVSADLKAQQQALLSKTLPHYYSHIEWLNDLNGFSLNGIILANEVIDALPVHLFKIHQDHSILEGRVVFQNNHWQLVYNTPITPGLIEAVQHLQSQLPHPFSVGYTSEISLYLKPWLHQLAACLQQGVMLFIDYGFPQHEYYHPSRSMGTLMGHSRHQSVMDPMQNIGLQDLTAHVDFSAVAHAAKETDLQVSGFTTQAAFLLSNQLLDLAQTYFSEDLKQNLQLSQQIQMLTAPHEMGELFKVMALSRSFDAPLQGFQGRDHTHRLFHINQ